MKDNPTPPRPEEVTVLLRAAEAGDQSALDRVFSVLYGPGGVPSSQERGVRP
jgi:hypothetical protein